MNKKFWSRVICAFAGMILAVTLLPGKAQAAGDLPTVTFYEGDFVTYGGESVRLLNMSGDLSDAYVLDGKIRYNLASQSQSFINNYCNYDSSSLRGPSIRLVVGYADGSTEEVPHEGWEIGGSSTSGYFYRKEKTFLVKNYPYALPQVALGAELLYNGQPQTVALPALTWRPQNAVADGAYASFAVSITDDGGNAVPYNSENGTVTVTEPGTYNIIYTFDPAARKNAEWWCLQEDKSQENGWSQMGGLWQTTGTIRVEQPDIADAAVTADPLTYSGQAQTPVLSVKLNGNELTQGVDYDVTVEAQKNAGTYPVKITGKGGYIGEKTLDWSIQPADINDAEATGLRVEYNGRFQGSELVVLRYGGVTLKESVDYWFYQGSSGADVGSYKQVVRGKGNFTGSKEVTVEIVPKKLTVVEVRVEDKGYDATTTGKILEVVIDGLGNVSVAVDYAASTAEFATPEVGQNKTVTGTIYLTGVNAPNYEAPLNYTATGNIFNDFYAQQGKEYTVNTNDWTNGNFEVMAAEGFTVCTIPDGTFGQSLAVGEEGEGEFTFYVKRLSDGRISNPVKETYRIDRTVPTGGITIGERSWTGFFAAVYDELTNQDLDMKVTAADEMSGVEEIAYIESETALTVEELAAKSGWITGDVVTIKAEDGKNVIYYARITDRAGNVAYLASNGTNFDTQAPKILGVEDGGVYYGSVEVSVDDTPGAFLRKGGGVVRHPYLLSGEEVGAHMFQSEDKAGNIQRVEFEILAVSALEEKLKDITPENVKRKDADVIEQVLQTQPGNAATEAEKAALKDVKEKAEKLLDALEEKVAATTPNTGDLLLPIAGAVCVLALAGIVVMLVIVKRRRK